MLQSVPAIHSVVRAYAVVRLYRPLSCAHSLLIDVRCCHVQHIVYRGTLYIIVCGILPFLARILRSRYKVLCEVLFFSIETIDCCHEAVCDAQCLCITMCVTHELTLCTAICFIIYALLNCKTIVPVSWWFYWCVEFINHFVFSNITVNCKAGSWSVHVPVCSAAQN